MSLLFEWNAAKARTNAKKHGITFEEASTVFGDKLSVTIRDPNAQGEVRFITIGYSAHGRLLIVIHTDRYDRIRVISARTVTKRERKQYEEV